MANSYYCTQCGSKTTTDFTPRVCARCGTPFFTSVSPSKPITASAAPPKVKKILPFKKEDMQDNFPDDDGTDIYEVPSLENVSYEIDYDNNANKGVQLGEILEANKGKKISKKKIKPTKSKPRGNPPKSKEQILEDFKKEISSNNGPIEIE